MRSGLSSSATSAHERDDRRAGSDWGEAIVQASQVHFADMGDIARVVIVAPHPDDESLGAGGMATAWSSAGAHVTIVVCTDGAAAFEPASPESVGLAERRSVELKTAVRCLAVGSRIEVHELGFADSQLGQHVHALARCLSGLVENADVVVGPWPGDGHPDHRAAGEAVRMIAGDRLLFEYPIWAYEWSTPDSIEHGRSLITVPLSASAQRAKRLAVDAHQSQVQGRDPIVSESFRRHFHGAEEVFIVADSTIQGLKRRSRTSAEFFDMLYRTAPSGDPWELLDEENGERYDRMVASVLAKANLPISRTLELGAGTGQLTSRLARCSGSVLAIEASPSAADTARSRCIGFDSVEIRTAMAPHGLEAHDVGFDCVVLSDVGYYFDAAALGAIVADLHTRCADRATLVASHWLGTSDDHVLGAQRVHEVIDEVLVAKHRWERRSVSNEATHVVDVWSRP